jgi:hypothetical protein
MNVIKVRTPDTQIPVGQYRIEFELLLFCGSYVKAIYLALYMVHTEPLVILSSFSTDL